MSDRMKPISFSKLMNWIFEEYRNKGTLFSVRKPFIKKWNQTYQLFGETLETVFGPAAGPHTQLAQNIIASYFAGARFFELKTVQTLDGEDLPVSKPCIKAEEEGYNVEWSTELRVQEAMEEYIKAWYAIKLLSKEFNLGNPDGFVFNMSVGYDLEGIKSDKINHFIEGLKDAASTSIWKECKAVALEHISEYKNVDEDYIHKISSHVCKSATLSTLHGCPPDEIERIAMYLLHEKNLHTFIKCNPTLLGYEYARNTLDEMGYAYLDFDEHHFNDDLQFKDAIPMIERLRNAASQKELTFGVKLTNTFPVNIKNKELPGEEMYMSGAALYPLSISLASKLSQAFKGQLQISFSGGANVFNIEDIVTCGIWPVTMATTLLKPGGYMRMTQIAHKLEEVSKQYPQDIITFKGVDITALEELVSKAKMDQHHVKNIKSMEPYKSNKPLPLIDCFVASCQDSCPIHQDIPAYIKLAGEGKYEEALAVIMDKNPLPFITGTICNHRCMSRCTRNFYEESVHIRDVKLESARNAYDQIIDKITSHQLNDVNKAAIVGGGPAGMAAAFFLARGGVAVTIFEKEESLGGIVRTVIPEFRISHEAIDKDISFLEKMGVTIKTNTEIKSAQDLTQQGFQHIIVAVGANKAIPVDIEGANPFEAIEFLKAAKANTVKLGENVVVVGAGNTAMDVARVAKRLPGVKQVSLVYRRTKRLMPADEEEYNLAIEEGIVFYELTNPVSYRDQILKCEKMILGDFDTSGRRAPQPTGEYLLIPANDIIISAGEKVDKEWIANNFGLDAIVIGDCNEKPKTVVEAIKDAKEAVEKIGIQTKGDQEIDTVTDTTGIYNKKGLLKHASQEHETNRCLNCSTVCENCVDVCPNRANVQILIGDNRQPQILHIDDMCNECGNCASFCPTAGSPYKDKLTLFSTVELLKESQNLGFYVDKETGDVQVSEGLQGQNNSDVKAIIEAVKNKYRYLL